MSKNNHAKGRRGPLQVWEAVCDECGQIFDLRTGRGMCRCGIDESWSGGGGLHPIASARSPAAPRSRYGAHARAERSEHAE